MRKKTRFFWLALVTTGVLVSGCITHEETVYRDVSRIDVKFENDTAAGIFYGALARSTSGHGVQDSTTRVTVPFLLHSKQRIVKGDSAVFNEAAARCDANKDGVITEAEARSFAEHP